MVGMLHDYCMSFCICRIMSCRRNHRNINDTTTITMQYIAMDASTTEGDDDFLLMDSEEYEASVRFTNEHIIPRIVNDWTTNDTTLVNEWLQFANKHRPPMHIQQTMLELYSNYRDEVIKPRDERLREVELRRIGYIIERYHQFLEFCREKSANRKKEEYLREKIRELKSAIASKDPSYSRGSAMKSQGSKSTSAFAKDSDKKKRGFSSEGSGSARYTNNNRTWDGSKNNSSSRSNSYSSGDGGGRSGSTDDNGDDNFSHENILLKTTADYDNVDVSSMILTVKQLELKAMQLRNVRWTFAEEKFKHKLFLPNSVASELVSWPMTTIHAYIHKHIYLPKHAYVHFNAYILTYTHTCIHTFIHKYMHACIHTTHIHSYIQYIHTYKHTYIHAYIYTYIHACMHTTHIHSYIHIHTYLHIYTYMHTYIHACIHTTHIHTTIHAYIHIQYIHVMICYALILCMQ